MASLAQSQPWVAEGISRATWFRRQKEKGSPDGRRKQKRFVAANCAEPVIDAAIPRNALLKASMAELATVGTRGAAIGPGAVKTKTGGRFDVVTSAAFEARQKSPPRPMSPPKSMVAIGGVAGPGLIPQGRGMPLPPDQAAVSAYTHARQFEAQTTAVIAELVARDKEKERRIAALEAEAADRRARAGELVQAFLGFVQLAVGGH
jgi:hypothetical protein